MHVCMYACMYVQICACARACVYIRKKGDKKEGEDDAFSPLFINARILLFSHRKRDAWGAMGRGIHLPCPVGASLPALAASL